MELSLQNPKATGGAEAAGGRPDEELAPATPVLAQDSKYGDNIQGSLRY